MLYVISDDIYMKREKFDYPIDLWLFIRFYIVPIIEITV